MPARSCLAAVLLLASAAVCPAAVLYDNTSAAVGGADAATATNYVASSFTTSGATTQLSARLLLQQLAAGNDTLSVYSSSTYTPDTLVGTLTAAGTPSTAAASLVTYTGTGLSLSADTPYWLVLSSTGGVAWSYSSDATLTNAWAQGTAGSPVVWYATGDSYPYVFSVSDVVPEPATLGGVLTAGAILLRRRRA